MAVRMDSAARLFYLFIFVCKAVENNSMVPIMYQAVHYSDKLEVVTWS